MSAFDELIAVVARLRDPDGGCPWDQSQTPQSVRAYVLEEAYEVVDAIDGGAADSVREELGDLLFNVVLLAQMASEAGDFTMQDVVRDIHDKMIRRHPHVFGQHAGSDWNRAKIAANWEQTKKLERRTSQPEASALDGVPRALPALLRAQKVGAKAARIGFDWPDRSGPRAKVDEELQELDEALEAEDAAATAEELGDVLFSVVNLARHLVGPDGRPAVAEDALRATTEKFERRFRRVEALAREHGQDVHGAGLEALDAWWNRAKMEEETRSPVGQPAETQASRDP